MRVLLAACLAASTALAASAARAEEKHYGEGRLDVLCSCLSKDTPVYSWHYLVDVPAHGRTLDLGPACKLARSNDHTANVKCRWWHTYQGVEHAFTPKQ
jgi:hypothetical protein